MLYISLPLLRSFAKCSLFRSVEFVSGQFDIANGHFNGVPSKITKAMFPSRFGDFLDFFILIQLPIFYLLLVLFIHLLT